MARIELTDQQKAALNTSGHLVVRANAGSGKTFILTLRYVWLLLEHGLPIDSVVAITFTKKAAAEMRSRVRDELDRLKHDPERRASLGFSVGDDTVMSRIDQYLHEIGKARISTFHSFAASIVRQHGYELEINPESQDLADTEKRALLRQAVRAAIRSGIENGTITPAHELLGIQTTEDVVLSLAGSAETLDLLKQWDLSPHDIAKRRLATMPPSLATYLKAIATDLRAELLSLGATQHIEGQRICDGLLQVAEDLTQFDGSSEAEDKNRLSTPERSDLILSIAAKLDDYLSVVYTKDGTGRKKHKPLPVTAEFSPLPSCGKVRAWAAEVIKGNEDRQAEVFRAVLTAAFDAEKLYAELKRDRNVIDFDDMMRHSVRLFQQHAKVAAGFRRIIKHLMVDEFQDTNPLQYKLIELLVPDLCDRTARMQETTLFVVGDDKQSIYGFRDADVRLFSKVDEAIRESNDRCNHRGASSVRLQQSYRMTPPLAKKVNAICKAVFAIDSEYDVEYASLESARTYGVNATLGSLRVFGTDKANSQESEAGDTEDNADAEVRLVLERVLAILSGTDDITIPTEDGSGVRKPKASDIAVLVRRRNTVSGIARALQAEGIPVQLHGGRAFFSRPEIADVRNLLQVLADESDSLALAALLRSPLFGITDATLFTIAATQSKPTLSWEALASYVRRDTADASVVNAYTTLCDLRTRLVDHSVDEVIQHALRQSQWYDSLNGDPRASQAIDNVAKLLDMVRDAASRDGATLYDVIDRIAVPDETDNEAESTESEGGYGVQVMTLHASKGLEFPIVILADISSQVNPPSTKSSSDLGPTYSIDDKEVSEDNPVTKVEASIGASHLANSLVDMLREQAETRRLLYVALTRAEYHVLVIVQYSTLKDGRQSVRGGIGKLIQQWFGYFASPQFDATPSAEDHAELTKDYYDLSHTISAEPYADVINVTSLVDDVPTLTNMPASPNARTRGTEVHEALALVLSGGRHLTTHADEIVQKFLDARASWEHIPSDAFVETEHVALLDQTLVVGRADLVFYSDSETLHIWDWKVIEPATDEDRNRLLDHYRPQLAGYAWLFMKANPAIQQVHARLLFVPLASNHLDEWSVGCEFYRSDLTELEAAIRSRSAIPAA